MTINEAKQNIGRHVIYTPYSNCPKDQLELGIITGVSESYVFVRYKDEVISKATRPEDLTLGE